MLAFDQATAQHPRRRAHQEAKPDMAKTLPTITLLFAGGATLQTEAGKLVTVRSADDIAAWVDNFPELNLIAKVEPVFVLPDGKDIEPEDWNTVSKLIKEKYATSDGFVLLQGVDSMLYTGAFLSFALQGLGKPVVLTGSPLTPEHSTAQDLKGYISHYRTLGVRANLINSVQVATQNLTEVSILFGNQLLRANRGRKSPGTSFNVFEADETDILGRVDFGIKLKAEQERKNDPLHVVALQQKRVAIVRLHPGSHPDELASVVQNKPDAIILHTYMQSGIPDKLAAHLRLAEQQGIAVIVFNPYLGINVPGGPGATMSGMSYEALYAKVLWVLSKTTNAEVVNTLLQQPVANEFGTGKETGV